MNPLRRILRAIDHWADNGPHGIDAHVGEALAVGNSGHQAPGRDFPPPAPATPPAAEASPPPRAEGGSPARLLPLPSGPVLPPRHTIACVVWTWDCECTWMWDRRTCTWLPADVCAEHRVPGNWGEWEREMSR